MKRIFLVFLVFVLCLSSVFAMDRPTVALVLSGGGAKGIAHVAVLEKLEELGIPIDIVLGTSMGSLIGGLYSAGYSPNDIRELIAANDLTELFTTIESTGYKPLKEPFDYNADDLSISLGSGVMGINGFLDDYKIMNFFYSAIGNIPQDMDFDDLPTPFRCIGANAVTGKRIIFDHGDLIDCMRASMSIPIVFPPKTVEGELYVDGGLVDNMPVDVAKEMGYDIVIAVDVNAKFDVTQESYNSMSGTLGALFRVIINNTINEQKKHADLLLEPDLRGIGTLSFGNPDEIIKRGTDEVILKADQIQAIADLFPENMKVYKNPKRKGMYFTKYITAVPRTQKSSSEKKIEKALHQTRFSIGLSLDGGFHYYFKENFYGLTMMPELRLKLFLKNIGNSYVSSETQLNVSRVISVSQKFLFPVFKRNLYVSLGGNASMGSLSSITDRDLKLASYNRTEFSWNGDLGLKITDERTHNIDITANVSGYRVALPLFDGDIYDLNGSGYNYFHPYGKLSAVWYGDDSSDNLGDDLRLDFVGTAGVYQKLFTYKIVFSAEKEWAVGDRNGIKFEMTAHTTREPLRLRSSYNSYGGWNGMPGYNSKTYYPDFAYAGIGYERLLKKGLMDTLLLFEVKGGVRSKYDYYSYFTSDVTGAISRYPFVDMAENLHWDVGAGVAIDFRNKMADFKVGAGFNKDLMLSIYLVLE